jgi:16S rRNA (guanine527-N7)-methyltransferase
VTGRGDAAPTLAAYEFLVRRWAGRLDLVAPGDLERFAQRHIRDSLRALPLLDELGPGACADVGSGAGLPGIPLAITEPDRLWHLLEPRRRRAAFLEEVIRELDLNCEVLAVTAEAAARDPALLKSHALTTARALAAPQRAFALVRPLIAAGGIGAVWLGGGAKVPEIAEEWAPGIAIIRAGRD